LLFAAIAVLVVAIGIAGRTSKTSPHGATHASTAPLPELRRPTRRVKGRHDRPVPILMYHVVAPAPIGARYPELYVSGRDFAAQMRDLAARGFRGVTLGQVFDYWRRGIALPRRPVVISFDDGYESQYRNALPVLKKLGWPGVLNLLVKNETPTWGLRPDKIRKLIAAGWEVDAHTINHLDLTTLSGAALREEVAGSRRLIERRFRVAVDFFCYPAGRFDAAVVAAVRAAGFRGATTEQPGLARPTERFTLPRIRIEETDGPGGPLRKLRALGD
jgi:peptidoglycan/xylan/chitin deacetylase (PgdA/CDA1 family)